MARERQSVEAAASRPRISQTWIRSGISLVVGLALWEVIARVFFPNSVFIVPFSEAVKRLWELTISGAVPFHLGVSLVEFILGYLIACVIGISVGTWMGISPKVRSFLSFWVDVFNATPVLALAPLFILMLGIGLESKIAFVAFVAVWTILLNTMTGFMHPDQSFLEMSRSFRATTWRQFVTIRVPMAIPSIAVGLRVGVGRAISGIIVGELFGSTGGLGYLLFSARDQFDTGAIFAAIMVLAGLALVAVGLMTVLERRLSKWRA